MAKRAEIYAKLLTQPTDGEIPVSSDGYKSAMDGMQNARREFEEHSELKEYFDLLLNFRIAIFCSARLKRGDSEFNLLSELSNRIVKARKIDIVSGGGPGGMEATNEGVMRAHEHAQANGKKFKAKSIGVRVELPFEDKPNPFLHIDTKHEHFSTRLHAFVSQCKGAFIGPGGFGTLLEMLYLVQLKQVQHLEKEFRIIAHPFWKPVLESVERTLLFDRLEHNEIPMVSPGDANLVQFSDDISEIVELFSADYDFWKKNIREKVRLIQAL